MSASRGDARPEGPTRARRRSLLDQLTDELLTYVESEGLAAGDKLPSLSALARRFGVATPTMREALRRLEATSVVSIRHGSGIYLREEAPRLVLANPSRQATKQTVALEVLDARLIIEPELTTRAAARRTDADITTMTAILDTADQAIADGDDEALGAATMSFHASIANASGNSVLAEALRAITELYLDHQIEIGRLFDDRELDQREHRDILAAVAAGRPQRARKLMTAHLQEVHDVVETRLQRTRRGRPRAQ